jgi:hypothetical protein
MLLGTLALQLALAGQAMPAVPLPLDLWPALSEHGSALPLPQKGVEPATALAAAASTLSVRCAGRAPAILNGRVTAARFSTCCQGSPTLACS